MEASAAAWRTPFDVLLELLSTKPWTAHSVRQKDPLLCVPIHKSDEASDDLRSLNVTK